MVTNIRQCTCPMSIRDVMKPKLDTEFGEHHSIVCPLYRKEKVA